MADHQAARQLFRHARREAVLVLVVNLLALAWTVGYCYLHGYQHDPASWLVQMGLATPRSASDLQLIAGVPDWVMYGIVVPWLVCAALTGLVYWLMPDDDLGQDQEEGAGHGA